MKKILPLFVVLLFLAGCSSSIDTSNLGEDERFQYAMKLFNNEDYLEAVDEFQAIILQFPGSQFVDDAHYFLAMCRFNRDEYLLAAFEFSRLIKNIPASEYVPDAQFKLAESYYKLSPPSSLDQRYSKNAIAEFQAFIEFFPINEKVTEAELKIFELNEKLAKKEYEAALIYERMDYSIGAIFYFDSVIDTYHDTRYAPMAMYRKIKLLEQRERVKEAVSEIDKFLLRYRNDSRISELELLRSNLESKISSL